MRRRLAIAVSALVVAALLAVALNGPVARAFDDGRSVPFDSPEARQARAAATEVVRGTPVDVEKEDDGDWEVTIRNGDERYEVELGADFEFVAVDYD